MRHATRYFAGSCLCLLAVRVALADGIVLDGLSARTIGRGGTNIAHSDSGTILHDNPAGMSFIDGCSLFEIGATGLFTDFRYSDTQNSTALSSNLYGMPEFSIIKRSADGAWTYGIGAFGPAGFGAPFNMNGPPSTPGSQSYRSFGALIKLMPGVSYQVTDQLSVGVTLGGALTMADLRGPYTLQSFPLTGTPTLMDLRTRGVGLCWSAGLMYQFDEATTLGLTYLSETRAHAVGETSVDVPGLGRSNYDSTVDVTWPRSVGAGIRHELCPHRILSADVIWFNWNNAFDDFGIHLNSPSTPGFPTTVEHFPLDWRDTVSLRLGYEFRLDDERTIRLGYVHHRSPIPTGTMTPFIPAALENAFSTGYGLKWQDWYVDLAYMFSFGPDVNVGTSQFVGGDFDQSVSRDQTHAVSISLIRKK